MFFGASFDADKMTKLKNQPGSISEHTQSTAYHASFRESKSNTIKSRQSSIYTEMVLAERSNGSWYTESQLKTSLIGNNLTQYNESDLKKVNDAIQSLISDNSLMVTSDGNLTIENMVHIFPTLLYKLGLYQSENSAGKQEKENGERNKDLNIDELKRQNIVQDQIVYFF